MAKLPTITTITSGYNSTTQINNNFEALRDAFENFLSRNGETPNTMTADLDLNNKNIINAGNVFTSGGNLATLHNITISSLSPSGGNDGDIWFVV